MSKKKNQTETENTSEKDHSPELHEAKENTQVITDPYGFKNYEIEEAQSRDEPIEDDDRLEEDDSQSPQDKAEALVESVLEEIEAQEQVEKNSQGSTQPETNGDDSALNENPDSEQSEEPQDPKSSKESKEEIEWDFTELQANIETLLFLSDRPVSAKKLRSAIHEDLSTTQFKEAISELQKRYEADHHGFELVAVANGFQFRTKLSQAAIAKKRTKVQTQKLSRGAMECLAITAYNQPILKDDIDQIRGVDSSYFIRQLLDRKLIHMSGRSELPGRPILYSTSTTFLELFNLNQVSDLPPLKELEQMLPASESDNPDEEETPEIRKLRSLVTEMKEDDERIAYDPKEDEAILSEMRQKIQSISVTTPLIEEEKEAKKAEKEAKKQKKEQKELEIEPTSSPVNETSSSTSSN